MDLFWFFWRLVCVQTFITKGEMLTCIMNIYEMFSYLVFLADYPF